MFAGQSIKKKKTRSKILSLKARCRSVPAKGAENTIRKVKAATTCNAESVALISATRVVVSLWDTIRYVPVVFLGEEIGDQEACFEKYRLVITNINFK
jgi:hypothetical protein